MHAKHIELSGVATEPSPTPEPPDPTPSVCVSLTTLKSFTTFGGPFQGGTVLYWNVTKGCPEVTIRLNNQTVPASASKLVDPLAGTEYRLTATLGGFSKQLGTQVALGGDTVSYAFGRGGVAGFKNSTDPAAGEAARIAGQVTSTISSSAKRGLLGKTIEVHVIPWNVSITGLPPWRQHAGQRYPDGQLVSEKRGLASREIFGANLVTLGVGEEELLRNSNRRNGHTFGHVLAHELGHMVLMHAAPKEQGNVESVLNTNPDGHDYVGDDEKTSRNYDEYFAEGTAALFRYPSWAPNIGEIHDYSPEGLAEKEPRLLTILRRVYPGAS